MVDTILNQNKHFLFLKQDRPCNLSQRLCLSQNLLSFDHWPANVLSLKMQGSTAVKGYAVYLGGPIIFYFFPRILKATELNHMSRDLFLE